MFKELFQYIGQYRKEGNSHFKKLLKHLKALQGKLRDNHQRAILDRNKIGT